MRYEQLKFAWHNRNVQHTIRVNNKGLLFSYMQLTYKDVTGGNRQKDHCYWLTTLHISKSAAITWVS